MRTTVAALILIGLAIPATARSKPKLPTQRTLDLGNGVILPITLVPAGTFAMGSPDDEPGRIGNEKIRRTQVTKPYYLGAHEVTQAEYQAVMGTNPTAAAHRFADPRNVGPNLPVVGVGYEEAVAFCATLSKRTGAKVRLPTEAEWENACRAGGTGAYGAGVTEETLASYAVFGKPARLSDPVGGKKPNALGLHDITGNVWEWTSDWFTDAYDPRQVRDPRGPAQPTGTRVFRGGCSFNKAELQRCAFRHTVDPGYKDAAIGFRVLVEP